MSRPLAPHAFAHFLAAVLLGASIAAAAVPAPAAAQQTSTDKAKPRIEPQSFPSAADAARALIAAAKAQDKAALLRIFGSDGEELVNSGDEVADRRGMEQFAAAAEKSMNLLEGEGGRIVMAVGEQRWPMPIPIVKRGEAWVFDAAAGKDEILTRRIGENELTAIDVMRAFVAAQKEYAEVDHDGDGIKKYARRIKSQPGKRDGLYWETKPGEALSPLGALVAEAEAEGYRPGYRLSQRGQPYYGYYFTMLLRQGPGAPGGAREYVVDNRMIAGFAMVAYPAQWGNSGVMTFIMNQDGVVYQKNLGARTAEIAPNMTAYNPDSSWERVKE